VYSPIQRDGNSSQPCAQHRANQSAVYLINGHQKRDNLSPSLAIHTMYIYKRERAKQRDVSAAEERVHVVRGNRGTEEHKRSREEGRRSDRGEQERKKRGLQYMLASTP
jgi:hypothetical protein